MTELELRCTEALKKVNFIPGSVAKKFAADMLALAQKEPGRILTAKQHGFLLDLVIRFGRQVRDAQLIADVQASLTAATAVSPVRAA